MKNMGIFKKQGFDAGATEIVVYGERSDDIIMISLCSRANEYSMFVSVLTFGFLCNIHEHKSPRLKTDCLP